MEVWLNGKLVPEDEACVSVYDHGFLYGDGVYETMRSYAGVVFMFERHFQRLRRSASLLALALPPEEAVRRAVSSTLRANGLTDAYIRITVSRGKGAIGLDPALCPEPTFVVIAAQFRDYPEELYTRGTSAIIARTRRNARSALDPRIKSLNFLNNILAKIEAKAAGAHEAIMLNPEGFITEGTVSNIFFQKGGLLCTPSVEAGILDGITRDLVIAAARESGLDVREGLFVPKDLLEADEVFYTNTSSEVMPVTRVDDVSFGVGRLAVMLRRAYRTKVEEFVAGRGDI